MVMIAAFGSLTVMVRVLLRGGVVDGGCVAMIARMAMPQAAQRTGKHVADRHTSGNSAIVRPRDHEAHYLPNAMELHDYRGQFRLDQYESSIEPGTSSFRFDGGPQLGLVVLTTIKRLENFNHTGPPLPSGPTYH